jgi:DNA modification methylase
MIERVVIRQTEFDIINVIVGPRKRSLGDTSSLAQSINELGLLHPITILPDGTLVGGYHRLEACKSLGWQTIPVIIREWEELHAELAEIDENIVRNELKQIEQVRHLQRRKEIYEVLHPTTKHGGDRKSSGQLDHLISSFAEDTAGKTGMAARTIRRHTQIAKSISPDLDEAILATPIADNQGELLKLARMEPAQQREVIEKLIETSTESVRRATDDLRHEKMLNTPINEEIASVDCSIYHCSVAEIHNHVEPGSLDAIITDPPYPREFLSVYTDLAEFAAYALKPGGSLIAMVGQSYIPEVLDRLREHLTYHWVACYYVPGDTTKLWHRNIGASWKPLLWFVKGKYVGQWVKDVVFMGRRKDKRHHEWGQPVDDMADIIEHFTQPGQLICDPFLGGGSTAIASLMCERGFVGCDINQQCVQTTKLRLHEAIAQRGIAEAM